MWSSNGRVSTPKPSANVHQLTLELTSVLVCAFLLWGIERSGVTHVKAEVRWRSSMAIHSSELLA